ALGGGVNENALEAELANGALGLLDEARPPARQHGREAIERALVLLLNLGGVVAPALHGRQLLIRTLAPQIVGGVAHHADVDARLVMRIEKIFEHHRTSALAPGRAALAVERAHIDGGLFRRRDRGVPVDDHSGFPSTRATCRPFCSGSECHASACAPPRPVNPAMRSQTRKPKTETAGRVIQTTEILRKN